MRGHAVIIMNTVTILMEIVDIRIVWQWNHRNVVIVVGGISGQGLSEIDNRVLGGAAGKIVSGRGGRVGRGHDGCCDSRQLVGYVRESHSRLLDENRI
jgi:hypothetical protein